MADLKEHAAEAAAAAAAVDYCFVAVAVAAAAAAVVEPFLTRDTQNVSETNS